MPINSVTTDPALSADRKMQLADAGIKSFERAQATLDKGLNVEVPRAKFGFLSLYGDTARNSDKITARRDEIAGYSNSAMKQLEFGARIVQKLAPEETEFQYDMNDVLSDLEDNPFQEHLIVAREQAEVGIQLLQLAAIE